MGRRYQMHVHVSFRDHQHRAGGRKGGPASLDIYGGATRRRTEDGDAQPTRQMTTSEALARRKGDKLGGYVVKYHGQYLGTLLSLVTHTTSGFSRRRPFCLGPSTWGSMAAWSGKKQKRAEGGRRCQAGHMANHFHIAVFLRLHQCSPHLVGPPCAQVGTHPPEESPNLALSHYIVDCGSGSGSGSGSAALGHRHTRGLGKHPNRWLRPREAALIRGAPLVKVNGLFLRPLQHPETRVLQRL